MKFPLTGHINPQNKCKMKFIVKAMFNLTIIKINIKLPHMPFKGSRLVVRLRAFRAAIRPFSRMCVHVRV